MNIVKEVGVCAVGVPDEQALEKIHRYCKTQLAAEQIYCFSVRLCDDQIDRDFERFDAGALEEMAALFLGKTGIADHDWSSERQVARIYDTAVKEEGGVRFLQAECYLLRTPKNEELIAEIGAAALVSFSGMETQNSLRNTAAYIQNWLTALKNDKRLIVSASGKAEKAVNLILNNQ